VTAAQIAATLLENDEFDPLAEIERMEVPPILAELGYTKKDSVSAHYAGYFKFLDPNCKIVVVLPKSLVHQAKEMVEVNLFDKPKGTRKFRLNCSQPVSVHDLPALLRNYERWFNQETMTESDDFNVQDYVLGAAEQSTDTYGKTSLPLHGIRRKGRGHVNQWDYPYKDWLFQVSAYRDGKTLWSASYKTHVYSWSTPKEKKQGYGWSGGSDIVELPAGADQNAYLKRLKKMADEWPAARVWRERKIPYMPPAEGPDRWRANY
jgi:hypothetical protein